MSRWSCIKHGAVGPEIDQSPDAPIVRFQCPICDEIEELRAEVERLKANPMISADGELMRQVGKLREERDELLKRAPLPEEAKRLRKLLDENESLRARVYSGEARYHKLVMSVGNKHEGETRHETALRYIKEAEKGNGPSSIAKPEEAEGRG